MFTMEKSIFCSLGYEMLFYALEKASNEQARNTF